MPFSPSCARARYRAFPVGRGSIDELLGVARKEDVLALLLQGQRFEFDKVLREPVVVPTSTKVLDAFELFKRAPIELAIVVDEYGGFEGVVTRTDLLEAIAGDLPEQAGEEPEVKELPDGALSIDGAVRCRTCRSALPRRAARRQLPDRGRTGARDSPAPP